MPPVASRTRVRKRRSSRRCACSYWQPLLRGNEPTPYAAVASFSDITERKNTEEALRESEHRWRSLTEALPQLVWTATPDGALDYGSAQIVQYMGRPESELLGWGWLERLHPEDRERTRQAWRAAVEGQSDYEIEHRFRRFDGTYRWFKTRGLAIRDSEDNVYKWLGTCTDITTDKQLEEELRQAHERFYLAVRGSNLAIWEVDMPDGLIEKGRVTLVNAWESLGYDPAEAPTDLPACLPSRCIRRTRPGSVARFRRAWTAKLGSSISSIGSRTRTARNTGTSRAARCCATRREDPFDLSAAESISPTSNGPRKRYARASNGFGHSWIMPRMRSSCSTTETWSSTC